MMPCVARQFKSTPNHRFCSEDLSGGPAGKTSDAAIGENYTPNSIAALTQAARVMSNRTTAAKPYEAGAGDQQSEKYVPPENQRPNWNVDLSSKAETPAVQERTDVRGAGSEIVEPPVEMKKRDGSIVKLEGGFVTEVHKGDNSQTIEYQRDAGNKVKLDANGAPLVEKITTRMNGQESVIDLSGSTQDDGLKELASRIQIVQKGDNIGNVMIASDDGKRVSTMHSDFTNTTHEIIEVAGKSVSRLESAVKSDGSITEYKYTDESKPTRPTQIIERYQSAMGGQIVQISDRVGDTERFVTNTQGTDKTTWRKNVQIMDDGNLAYQEIVTNFMVGPREYSSADLATAREDFLKVAARHGVFKGNEATIESWMNKFERRQQRFADKGWKAASHDDIAESYRNLSRVFTDEPRGNAKRVTAAERRLAVQTELMELGDPVKFINQGPVGTCALNSVEDTLAQRRPQDLTRWLREALTTGCVTSRGVTKNGQKRVVELGANQIKYQPTYHRTYSNQLFQFAAMATLGYKSNGGNFPGTTNDQMEYVRTMATGQKMAIHDTWTGGRYKKENLINQLKHGSVGYIVPGHAMAIDDYDPKTDRFLVNNWWGGSGDGWYSARRLMLR
ncbi:MAG: hypothetical protein C0469_18510 [Cyanobacteria bacterium DS2.3.42]|nr:hypothetical protein [Cyanobacteria bacterium DS2.3.42]